MTTIAVRPAATRVRGAARMLGPNWFASVMGTGIVANAAATLPVHLTGAEVLARVMWAAAVAMLILLGGAVVRQEVEHPGTTRRHLADPVMSHFFGAPAMAALTVGAGALLVGHDLIGLPAAVALDVVLWSAGTALGLWTLVAIPRRALRGSSYAGPAFGGWLMPVVPPMVSAATGPLLVPHLPPAVRPVVLIACCLMFVVALVASLPLIVLIAHGVQRRHLGAAATIPTLVIVVGPLGQSATAAHALSTRIHGLDTVAVAFGSAVLGLAGAWLVVATRLVWRAVLGGMPFAMTWWSFTFPIGTLVTGTSGLAVATGSTTIGVGALVLFALLVAAWTLVAARTLHGVRTGELCR